MDTSVLDLDQLRAVLGAGRGPGESRAGLLARALRQRIASGAVRPGDRLPAVRQLAALLSVHPRVVAAAYAALRAEGLVQGRAGAGTAVARARSARSDEQRARRLALLADDLVSRALAEGYAPEEVETAVATAAGRWRAARAAEEARPGPKRPRTLVLAGSHDLALELLVAELGTGRHPVRLIPRFVGSLPGLLELASGVADLASVHLLDPTTGEYNAPFVRRLLGPGAARLVLVAERVQGLMLAPGNPRGVRSIADLARLDLRLANRQSGSGTRVLLDLLLHRAGIASAGLRGYERELPTHFAVAQAVGQGEADVGLGIEPAARSLGLAFLPVARERYELVLLEARTAEPALQRVRAVLRSDAFRAGVAQLGGYHAERSGEERRVD